MCKFGNDLLLRIGDREIHLYDTSSGKHRLLFEAESYVWSLTSFNDSIFVGTYDQSVHRYSSSGNLESSFKCGLYPERIFVKEECLIVSEFNPFRSEIYSHDNSLLKKFDDEQILHQDSHYLYLTSGKDFIIRLNEDAYGEIGRVDLGDDVEFIAELEEGLLIVRCDNSIHRIRFNESRIEIVDKSELQPGFGYYNGLHIIKHASGGSLVIESHNRGIRFLVFSKSMEFNGDVPFASSLICNKVLPPPSDIMNVYSLELHQIDDFTCLSMALFLRRLDVRNNGLNERQMGSLCKSIMSLPNLKELLVEGNDFTVDLVHLKRRTGFNLDIQIITKEGANENLVRLKNNLLVVLLGHSGAGKTVLAECIKTGKLQAPGTHESTSTVQSPISQPISKLFGKNIPAVWDFPGQIQNFITNRVFLSNPFFVPVLVSDLSLDYEELLACQSFWVRLLACASESQFQTVSGDQNEGTKSLETNLLKVPKIILVGTHMDLCEENAMKKMTKLKKDLEEFCALHHHHLKFDDEIFPVCSVTVGASPPGDRLDDVKRYLSVTSVQETRLPVEWKNAQHRFRKSVKGTGLILNRNEFASRVFKKGVEPELLNDVLQFLTATGDIIFSENDLDDNVVINPIKFGEIVSLFVAPIETRSDKSLLFAEDVRNNNGEVTELSLYGDLLLSISIEGITEEGIDSVETAHEIRKEALEAAERMVERMGIIYIKNKSSEEIPEGENVIVCPALMGEPNSAKFSSELDEFCFKKLGLQRFVFGQCVSSGKRSVRTVKEKKSGIGSITGRALDAAILKRDSTGAICYPPGRFEEFVKSVVSDDSRLYRNVVMFSTDDCVVLLQLESFFMRHIYIICYSKSLDKARKVTNELRSKLETICGKSNVFSGCMCPTCIDISPLQSSDSFQRCCNFDDNMKIPEICHFMGQKVVNLKYKPFFGKEFGDADLLGKTLAVTSVANSMVNICNDGCREIAKLKVLKPVLEFAPGVAPAFTTIGMIIEKTSGQATSLINLVNDVSQNNKEMDELIDFVRLIQTYLETSKNDMNKPGEGHIVSRGYLQSLHYLNLHLTEVYNLIKRYKGESRTEGKTWLQCISDGPWRKLFYKKTWTIGFRIFGCEFFKSEMTRLRRNLESAAADFRAWATREGLNEIKAQLNVLIKEQMQMIKEQRRIARGVDIGNEKLDDIAEGLRFVKEKVNKLVPNEE